QPEYEQMVIRIISHMRQTGEWGEFLPSTLSPFAYNESTAFDLFPLTREQAVSAGLRWKDEETNETIDAEAQVPDDSRTINSGICKLRFACSSCKRSFRITPQELALYQKLNVAAPNDCFLCRHRRRLAQRNPRRLWQRECAKCRTGVLTTFSPERPEIIYCEDCYLRQAVML
ncbi:MAG TPA: hypothetical protein PLP17_04215, partial [Oligoflexia bacterium]|nr:hypothetical protein [Oligoflexia bacterium]